MLVLVKETLGDDWLTPDRFRIGASSLLNDLLMQYAKTQTRPLRARPRTSRRSERWPRRTQRTALVWDYAPAPESPDARPAARRATGCSSTASSRDPADGTRVPTINPATEEPLAEVAFAGRGRRARAPSRPPAPPSRAGQRCRALERGKYLFRIARLIQERARELAIVESIDGGKPIRESRDVDVPLAAAHFFHYAGWADKLSYGARRPRASSRSASSARSCRGTSRC